MTWTPWIPAIAALVAAIPAYRSLVTIRTDRSMGVRTADREDRDQVAAASAGFIDRLMTRVDSLEARMGVMEGDRAADQEYIRLLLAHIWAGSPPPPPPRPTPPAPTA